MDRRQFLKTSLATSGVMILGPQFYCGSFGKRYLSIPSGHMPSKLWVSDIPRNMNYHEKVFLTCFQGLVNRTQTRVFLLESKADRFWMNYYRDTFAVEIEHVSDPNDIVTLFNDEIDGCIVYDPERPHSLNNATTMGALQNAVPVSSALIAKVRQLGLRQIDDVSNRWKDMYEAYEWALQELQPQCDQRVLAQLCVHYPHWPTSTFANRDYVIAHKIMAVDISSSERDKKDYALLRKIYDAYPDQTLVIGWHCVRDREHEAIALSAEYGHYGMCSLRMPNLTVHSSIELKPGKSFSQRQIRKRDLKVENKVYIAYMATDGDAAWFVNNLINTDWANPAHGSVKYNWGFLPMAIDLMPGMVQYYLENMLPNDYFVAGPAGATYTYPHLHPDPNKFLKLSNDYMRRCGLTTVHMTNWNDRDWWQEVDLPGFHDTLRRNMPSCVGYVRGMGESAFEPHYLKGGQPYVFCGEGIHKGNDIYQVMKDFIDACPNRPLFIYDLVNHSIPMSDIKEAMDRFPADKVEMVHVDELLLMIEKAYEHGLISEELYPDKKGVREIMVKEARQAWSPFYKELKSFQRDFSADDKKYMDSIQKTPIGLERIDAGEFLAFATIWHGMTLVKLALESRGIYVNHKPTATMKFVETFSDIADVKIITQLQQLWDEWHSINVDYEEAKTLAKRLIRIADALNKTKFTETNK